MVADFGVSTPMTDGTLLRADVYRPAASGRWPCVLLRTPYDKTQGSAFAQQVNVRRFVAAGYAVVIQDVRGRFESEGDFYPFVYEASDGADTLRWIHEQSWCSGRVGMAGTSYAGYAQVLAACGAADQLQAWVPAFAPWNARDGWAYEGGAFCLGFNLAWTFGAIAPTDRRTHDPQALLRRVSAWDDFLRCRLDDDADLNIPAARFFFDWMDSDGDHSYWDRCSPGDTLDTPIPALAVGGWFDLFGKGTPALFSELNSTWSDRGSRLVMGPWDHSPLPLQRAAGDSDFGPEASADLTGLQIGWFDWLLREESEPLQPIAKIFISGWNRWENLDRWPPDNRPQEWFLEPDGRLSQVPGHPTTVPLVLSAENPTPTCGGQLFSWPGHMRPGQVDQRPRENRADVLSFTSESWDREMLLLGPVRAEMWSSTECSEADIFVTVTDVAQDGRSLNLVEGVRRLPGARGAKLFSVDLGWLAHVLLPGHRLRVDVSGMSFPRFDRRPVSGTAKREIILGGETPSHIIVPVVRC
jgi:putative CocE/NonD family hydrolase